MNFNYWLVRQRNAKVMAYSLNVGLNRCSSYDPASNRQPYTPCAGVGRMTQMLVAKRVKSVHGTPSNVPAKLMNRKIQHITTAIRGATCWPMGVHAGIPVGATRPTHVRYAPKFYFVKLLIASNVMLNGLLGFN